MTTADECPDDGCDLCAGRAAKAAGEPRTANPYPKSPSFDADGEPTPWFMWDMGWTAPPVGWWDDPAYVTVDDDGNRMPARLVGTEKPIVFDTVEEAREHQRQQDERIARDRGPENIPADIPAGGDSGEE